MVLVQQVCSLELAQKLKELGVKQDSLFAWLKDANADKGFDDWTLVHIGQWIDNESEIGFCRQLSNKSIEWCSAFTVAELGEMLKESEWRLPYVRENGRWWTGGFDDEPTSDTEADARAKMLVWVMECELKK